MNRVPSAAMRWASALMATAHYLLGGKASGCTLPQSGPLYDAVDTMVMFIALEPIAIDI